MSSLAPAMLTLALLAALLVWALRPQPSHGIVGANDPTAGQVFQVAVDMDTTGNPAGSGGLLSSLESSATIGVGFSLDIDVVVDEVDPGDGMAGFSFNLKFDPSVVRIVTKDFKSYMLPESAEFFAAPIPDATGNRRMDVAQLGANVSGEGVLVRLGIECVAGGTSPIDLADDAPHPDGIPDILDPVGISIPVLNTVDGQITCATGGPTPTPGPTATPTATPPLGDPPTSGLGVNDPVPGQVNQVAVDMDTTGNPAGAGGLVPSLESSATIAVGETLDIDIVVDEVDPGDGMAGFAFNFKFDPAVVRIVSRDFNSYMLPESFELFAAPIPDATGNRRMDVSQLGNYASGEGVLVRLGIECVAAGTSLLDLADDLFFADGIPDILGPIGAPLNVLNAVDGQITCVSGSAPGPTPSPTPTPTPEATPPRFPPATPTPTPTWTPPPAPTPTSTPPSTPMPPPTTLEPGLVTGPAGPGAFPSTGDGGVLAGGSSLGLLLLISGVALAIGAGLAGFAVRRRTA